MASRITVGSALLDGRLSDAEIETLAKKYFQKKEKILALRLSLEILFQLKITIKIMFLNTNIII